MYYSLSKLCVLAGVKKGVYAPNNKLDMYKIFMFHYKSTTYEAIVSI